VHRATNTQGASAAWQRLLEERTQRAVDVLARVEGVLGLILCGSVGRGETWPLSDIDMILIYEDGRAEEAAGDVEARRSELSEWWAGEGYSTALDVGKLAFTRSEVAQALSLPPGGAARLLDDQRWFHSTDKGYGSRAAFDPEGVAGALSRWLTDARFTSEVVNGRLEGHLRQAWQRYEEAVVALDEREALAAAIALRESLHALTRYLMERWGGRDNSWGRFGTQLERTASERGEADLIAKIMALYGLAPKEVARRMALAPEGIRYWHKLSLEGRRLVGESVTEEQDARDVLLVFATREVRQRQPPYGDWVGLEIESAVLSGSLDQYANILGRFGASHTSQS
jgi:predicted nucleotidyltransferase